MAYILQVAAWLIAIILAAIASFLLIVAYNFVIEKIIRKKNYRIPIFSDDSGDRGLMMFSPIWGFLTPLLLTISSKWLSVGINNASLFILFMPVVFQIIQLTINRFTIVHILSTLLGIYVFIWN